MTSDVQDIVSGVKAGRGPAGMLLRDEAVADQIRAAVKNVQQASSGISHAALQADALVSDLKSRELPQQASDFVASLNDSARQVNQVIADLSKPDQNGMSAGANIRETLTNANTAAANLADDGEALKHNFFLRGFFKKCSVLVSNHFFRPVLIHKKALRGITDRGAAEGLKGRLEERIEHLFPGGQKS